MELFELDLSRHGAPGFSLVDRLDLGLGRTNPHIDTDLKFGGNSLRYCPPADFRDLSHNQLPGFNGMQNS